MPLTQIRYSTRLAACRSPHGVASVTSISAGSTVTPDICADLGMSSVADETWRVLLKNQPTGEFEREFDRELAVRYTHHLYQGDGRNAAVATNHIHAMSTVPASLVADLETVCCPFLVIDGTPGPKSPRP